MTYCGSSELVRLDTSISDLITAGRPRTVLIIGLV